MKKRLVALMTAVCLAVAPVSVLAEETDYSYLEDMSVKELKELRDEINKILGDEGASSSVSEFGSLSGTLTYFYNDYKGNVADADSSVLLVSKELDKADINTEGLIDFAIGTKYEEPKFGEGVYFVHVGGTGTYNIGHLPAGEYVALLISGQAKGQGWFDATNDSETDPKFYEGIASGFGDLLNEDDAMKIAEAVLWAKYTFKDVTIYGGENTTLDYDFGMTYI